MVALINLVKSNRLC